MTTFEQAIPREWDDATIEAAAEAFAAEQGFTAGLGSIRALVERMGGCILVTGEPTGTDEFDGGLIEVLGPRSFMVKFHMAANQRPDAFSIAHEIAHYVLHSGEPCGTRHIRVARRGRGEVDREADRFAAALLMPRTAFLLQAQLCRDDPASLATWFGVSIAEAAARLDMLAR